MAYRYVDTLALARSLPGLKEVGGCKSHLGALCVVAANLAERAWAVMDRGMPYVICDTDDRPVTSEEAKAIIAERFSVPADVRLRRRSKKVGGEGPQERPLGTIGATRSRRQPTGPPPPAESCVMAS